LLLVARRLASQGAEVLLVPMSVQGYDVPSFQPHVILLNYIRTNNIGRLIEYKRRGFFVAVLDTEGAAGKTLADYARMVGRMSPALWVDHYYLWGEAQRVEFLKAGVMAEDKVFLTGAPRYDFAVPPLRSAIPAPLGGEAYALITTNFQLVNPRYSKGVRQERQVLARVWADKQYIENLVSEGVRAMNLFIDAIGRLASAFPNQLFVVRPHPFESDAPYLERLQYPNIRVRRDGSSLPWIRDCHFLVHLNSSTALEAVLLGRIPVSLDWLVTPTLRLAGPSDVSVRLKGVDELISVSRDLFAGRGLSQDEDRRLAVERLIPPVYGPVDGKSAKRVADLLLNLADKKDHLPGKNSVGPSRGRETLGAFHGRRPGVRSFLESAPRLDLCDPGRNRISAYANLSATVKPASILRRLWGFGIDAARFSARCGYCRRSNS
jgi:surface carbohydrate biosynthesis protein